MAEEVTVAIRVALAAKVVAQAVPAAVMAVAVPTAVRVWHHGR